ncbi:MAG: hypothetical protein P8Y25_13260, partial [Chromatiaceae bacterium]
RHRPLRHGLIKQIHRPAGSSLKLAGLLYDLSAFEGESLRHLRDGTQPPLSQAASIGSSVPWRGTAGDREYLSAVR